jgi:23S rRNA pseudouridine2605 synthase
MTADDSDRREAGRASGHDAERTVPMRLQKFLARAGVASRRGSEDLMTAGRVAVNGVTTTELGAKVDPTVDVVTVDGATVTWGAAPVYLALHKPAGVVTTMSDPQGRATVAELVPVAENPGLFPVGRLDADTTGLLLFTTDGELSHRLLHPRWKVPKTYVVLADGQVSERAIERLRSGIELDDGPTAPATVVTVARLATTTRLEITISEGRKRQVRRMFSAVGHPVLELERVRFGPVELGDLEQGRWRELTQAELDALRQAAGMSDSEGL